MSHTPTPDEEKLDLMAIACGACEAWRSSRREKASKRLQERRATADKKAMRAASEPMASLVERVPLVKRASLVETASLMARKGGRKSREIVNAVSEKAKKGIVRIGAIKLRKILVAFVVFAPLYFGSVCAVMLAGCFVNASYDWVSVNQDAAPKGLLDTHDWVLSQNHRWLIEKETFFKFKTLDHPSCLASGACKELNLGLRDWLSWQISGTPPRELSSRGWKKTSWWETSMEIAQGTVTMSILLCAGMVLFGTLFTKAQETARERSRRDVLANWAQAMESGCWVALAIAAGCLLAWGAAAMWRAPEIGGKNGAAPSVFSAMQAIDEGRMKPEEAYWVSAGDPREWQSENPNLKLLAQKCVERGFCVAAAIEEKNPASQVSATVNRNRALAHALVDRDAQRGQWTFAFFAVGAAAFFCVQAFLLTWDRGEDSKWTQRLNRWASRGRQRIERAQLMTQVRQAKKSAKNKGRQKGGGNSGETAVCAPKRRSRL